MNTLNSLDRIWSNGDYETKVSVQNLLFQNGLYYDKQKDTYLTNEYNNAFLLLNQKFFKKKKGQESSFCSPSLSVPQTVTVSNFLIRDFERVKDFYLTYEQIILDVLGEDDYITIEDYI